MHALNIKIDSIQSLTKPVHNLYKDSLNNILHGNIENILSKIDYTMFEPLKQSISII